MIIGSNHALSLGRLTRLENFGHSLAAASYLYRPTHPEQVSELFDLSRDNGVHVGLRGAGRSYGDAALNAGGLVVDFRRMNRVLDWAPGSGLIRVEPGVTIEQLWKYTLEDGWWPPVVPGTMYPTLGGCLAANVHGKNNWKAGTLGEHVLAFTALLPNGDQLTCAPDQNEDLFYAMIGGMGLLGAFTSITLQMKRVHSGNLNVSAWAESCIERVLKAVDESKEQDYDVGWVDCTASGSALGRGQLHTASYLPPGEDPNHIQSLLVHNQTLPDAYFGLLPKSVLWLFMRLFMNNPGARLINSSKYAASRTLGNHKTYLQSLVAFNFLLDYVPNWEYAYGSGGLIQYQSFIPKANASGAFREMLRLCSRRGLPPYLGVVKRHRPDKFLLSHALDGFSFALDFRVTRTNRIALHALVDELDHLALEAGGRFYFAKDSTLTPEKIERSLGAQTLTKFIEFKQRCDPQGILQTDLYKRCFPV